MKKKYLSMALIAITVVLPLQVFAITTRVNTDVNGNEANNYSYLNGAYMTPNGRYIVFNSYANNLVLNDVNWTMDVFIKDTTNGSIKAVSSDISSNIGNSSSYLNGSSIISQDGRYVIFNSYATSFAPSAVFGNNNIFIKDTVTDNIGHISISYSGDDANSDSYAQSISADGTLVLFQSYADNLVTGDTNGQSDVFVRDIVGGTTERISVSSSGDQADSQSYPIAIINNGRYVLYYSYATNLVPNDTNNVVDLFLYDRQNHTVIRVNTDENGNEANEYTDPVYSNKGITDDAKYVIFYSDANNLVANDTNAVGDVFIKDIASGSIALVSTSISGDQSNNYSYPMALAASGRYVLFNSSASNLWSGNTYSDSHVYVKDILSGTLELIDTNSQGIIDQNGSSNGVDITPDGRYVLFQSSIDNLVPGDINGSWDSFVKDRITGKITLAHNNSYGEIGNSSNNAYQISDDGQIVLFQSDANNLVDNDTNYQQDIFTNEWQTLLMGKPIIVSPTNNSYLNINTILVQGIAATGAQVQIDISGNTYYTTGNTNDGSRSISLPILSDGLYTVQARQKYQSDIVWSPYQIHTFTIDTINPIAPGIITPVDSALIDTRSTYIVGTGEPGGTVRATVGATTKIGSIDGFGNWNIGPFTVLEGYMYAVQAQQIDIAGNQSPYSPIQSIYGVGQGVNSINPQDFTPDMILTKSGISNGSTTGTKKDQNITYSLTYDNIGNAYATGTIIYETIPSNTCFTLGSISGLQNNNIVEYSNNYGSTYSYVPTGIAGSQDCGITNIRVLFTNPLNASTYISVDDFNGTKYNTIGDNTMGIVLSEKDGINQYATGSRVRLSVFADINNDNNLDLITISTGGLDTKYHLFNGIGFDTGISYYTGVYMGADPCVTNCATQLFAGDVDGDGRNDIVAGNSGNGVLYFRNNGNGLDTPIAYNISRTGGFNIWGMTDLDNDGHMDVVSRGGYFMGSSTGFVGPFTGPQPPSAGSYQYYMNFGDLNNDGLKDILFNGAFYGTYSWYSFFQGGTTGFSSGYNLNPAGRGTYYGNNTIIDFNKDGWNDIILPYYNGTMIYYSNNQLGGFNTGYNIVPGGYPSSPVSLYGAAALDINNDGLVDVVGAGLNHPSKVFMGISSGIISSGDYVGQYFAEVTPAFGDIDNDGNKDLIFNKFNGYGDPMFYWRRNGSAYTTNGVVWSPNQYSVSFTDINNDQYSDIIGSYNGNLMYALNNTKGGSNDGITGTQFSDFYHAAQVSGSYTTILSASGSMQSWNKLIIGQDTISGENNISYSIYPVQNNTCDTNTGALMSGIYPNNGFVDISSIPVNNYSLCIVASFEIVQGVVSPKLTELFVTWTPDTISAFTFDVRVTNGYLSGNTVTNTAYITSNTYENNTSNNISSHIFALPPQTIPSGGFGGGLGGNGGGTPPSNGGGNNGGPTVVIKGDLTPQEVAEIIKEIDTTKPDKPVVVIPPRNTPPTSPVTSIEVKPTTPNLAIKEAIVQTSYVSVGSTVEVKTVENPALGSEKKCYTPKEVVDITLGKNTTNKDQLVYQALLKSYDLTMFSNTDTYMPENGLKRYEAAKMFTNFAKHVLCRESTAVYANTYTDIEGIDETLRPYIIQAYEYGILKGSKNEFRPLERISRKEFVAALMRMFTNENMDIQGKGNDWDTNYQAAFKAYGLESIVGVDEEINRYAMSKIMYKLYYNTTYEWTEKGYVLPYSY